MAKLLEEIFLKSNLCDWELMCDWELREDFRNSGQAAAETASKSADAAMEPSQTEESKYDACNWLVLVW